jgi:hypothetical protein
MRRLVLIVAVLMLVAAIPAPAVAAGPTNPTISVAVGEIHLDGKMFARVDVSYTCTAPTVPRGYELWAEEGMIYIDLHQASGRRVASEEALIWLDLETCDGAIHRMTVTIAAHSVAFKVGRALVDVEGSVGWMYSTGDDEDEDWGGLYAFDDTGWVRVRMHKR